MVLVFPGMKNLEKKIKPNEKLQSYLLQNKIAMFNKLSDLFNSENTV
ncbi:hypothetical protein BMS3Bbin16_00371 [archaeon BMS3Bbin16]|nr:hypothetical protein BMS3Bbin16_00371 [archaeon BMS3Bbin16]